MRLQDFLNEKISDMDMADVIKDFYKSDAPQFKGKSKKKRRQMAIAAKLNTEGSNDSYYAYQDAAKKWAKDTGKPEKDFSRAGVDVQDKYIEPEMEKRGLVPDQYQGKGVTSYRRESLEALARHIKEGVPLPDSLFRYQSEAYFGTFKQAKQLREMGSLPELDWESEEMLGTDIGESVELKGVGRVWLDVPYLDEGDEPNIADGMIGVPDKYYDEEQRREAYESSDENEALIAKVLAKALGDKRRAGEDPYSLFAELESENHQTADMIALMAKMIYGIKLQERAYKDVGVADVVKDRRGKEFKFDKDSKQFKSMDGEVADVSTKLGKDLLRLRRNAMKRTSPSYKKTVGEAEYQGKDVDLNKPKRGGSKKFYVYVKNPKTGKIKKVSFGAASGGGKLAVKLKDPKARKAFADRHNCDQKNDKTKPGYWSCRLPRYAKSLGLSGGGTWW